MVSAAVAQETLCSLANLISFTLVFPPLAAAYKIINTKSVEDFQLCSYLANLLHYMLWLIYKIIQPDYILSIPVTLTALLAQLVYFFIFYKFTHNPGRIKMIRTKSVKHVCLAVSLTSFLNACVWTAYAILKHDVYMHISNVVGVISGLLQLIVYAYYSLIASKLDEEKAEEELKNIPVDGADTVY